MTKIITLTLSDERLAEELSKVRAKNPPVDKLCAQFKGATAKQIIDLWQHKSREAFLNLMNITEGPTPLTYVIMNIPKP